MLRRTRNAALSLCAAALVWFHAPSAHAGCEIECTSVESTGFTVTPPLPCLEQAGAAEVNTCVCTSTLSLVNRCAEAVSLRGLDEGNCSDKPCQPTVLAPGENTSVTVYVPTPRVGERGMPRDESATAAYEVLRAGDGVTYRLEVGADARIDPEASACSVGSPRSTRHGVPLVFFGALGLAVVGLVRRRSSSGKTS